MEDKQALFAGGCFWCIEAAMRSKEGVTDVLSGFAGEDVGNVRYEEVAMHRVHAREAVMVYYDSKRLSYKDLVRHFFSVIDPTDEGGQFHDRGYPYTTCVYYQDATEKRIAEDVIEELDSSGLYDEPIVTTIEPMKDFMPAEEYHQRYAEKNPVRYGMYHEGSGRGSYEREMAKKRGDKGLKEE